MPAAVAFNATAGVENDARTEQGSMRFWQSLQTPVVPGLFNNRSTRELRRFWSGLVVTGFDGKLNDLKELKRSFRVSTTLKRIEDEASN